MQIDIQIRGPAACGKTHLAEKLEELICNALGDMPGTHQLEIKTGCVPDPRGLERHCRREIKGD